MPICSIASVAKDRDAVGDFQRLFLVVRDEQRGDVDFFVQMAQPAAQFLAHLGVQRAERLVEEQHFRLGGERAGERDALALAAGKLRRKTFRQRLKLDEAQQFFDAGANFLFRRTRFPRPHAQTKGNVFKNAHVPEECVMLKSKPGFAFAGGNLRHVFAVKQNLRLAGVVGKFQTRDRAQQRRLAGAGRAEQRDQFAGLDLDAYLVKRGEAAEFFRYVFDFNTHVSKSGKRKAKTANNR